MKIKYWNWLYFIGVLLPVFLYFGQFVNLPVLNGTASVPLVSSSISSSFFDCAIEYINFLPCSSIANLILDSSLASNQFVFAWTIGVDFVFWLSILHLIVDLFMLMPTIAKKFMSFGGLADE